MKLSWTTEDGDGRANGRQYAFTVAGEKLKIYDTKRNELFHIYEDSLPMHREIAELIENDQSPRRVTDKLWDAITEAYGAL